MGTRAAFWIGKPWNLENREWLGCVAWNGYPASELGELQHASSEEDFRLRVRTILERREDAALPEKGGWPFPWHDDIFLTDCTYAWFNDQTMFCYFHHEMLNLKFFLEQYALKDDFIDNLIEPPEQKNVPAPTKWDRSQPDSIMVLRAKG